ncbi:serine protease [Enterobacter asburiae]|uniref:serine protease n=1 Tax=Enterobacter asburiae TaxID=61645 RepID=UPI002075AB18|nr:serine protease [Enterobacter asburiae]MCM7771867.1 serine protease [Enterobacter asburiae]
MLISSVYYPYPSINDLFPNGLKESIVTQLTAPWERALVSFHAPKSNSTKELLTVGSGFLKLIEGHPFIFTASHVVRDIVDLDERYMMIDGELYPFEKTDVFLNDTQDYAAIEMPNKTSNPERGLIFFNNRPRPELSPTSSMIIAGFPASKNKFHKDKKYEGMSRLNFAFHHFQYNSLNEELHFPFDSRPGKGTPIYIEPESHYNSLPSLSGMSGAPVLQIMDNLETGSLTLRAVGIFKEHRAKTEKCLVANTFIQFADEVNKIFTIKSPFSESDI